MDANEFVTEFLAWRDAPIKGTGHAQYLNRLDKMARKLKRRVTFVCSHCGSEAVLRDAWASWDSTNQEWRLHGDPLDNCYCERCDGETSIVEKVLSEAQSSHEFASDGGGEFCSVCGQSCIGHE